MPFLRGARAARIKLGVREGKPVKVAELASRIGCSRSHLVRIEGGTAPASDELIALLANALDVTEDQLLIGTVPDEPPPQPKPQPRPKPRDDKGNKGPKRPESQAGAA